MDLYGVLFHQFFFEEEDGPENNNTLIAIRGITKPTCVILSVYGHEDASGRLSNTLFDESEYKDHLRERVRQLFHVISENVNIVKVEIHGNKIHIPGSLIGQWLLDWNKFVSELYISIPENQSDMQLLCDSIQQNTIIKNIIFEQIRTQESDARLLGKALQRNKGIETIRFSGWDTPGLVLKVILKDALDSCSNNIKSLALTNLDSNYSNIDIATLIENIVSKNCSLTSFTLKDTRGLKDNMLPILRGVINSSITEFHFFPSRWQNYPWTMITEMKKLKVFCFNLDNFQRGVSAEQISSTLEEMMITFSLNLLEIHAYTGQDLLKAIINDLSSTWQQHRCKLKLVCPFPSAELVGLLKFVTLENYDGIYINNVFYKLIDEIPKWCFLKALKYNFRRPFSQEQENMFADAISKNYSIQKILICRTNDTLREYVQNKIDQTLERNKRLAVSKEYPDKVPLIEWPELFSIADPTRLDFSYECIRKIPNVFINLLTTVGNHLDN